jgi:hypothetical protein
MHCCMARRVEQGGFTSGRRKNPCGSLSVSVTNVDTYMLGDIKSLFDLFNGIYAKNAYQKAVSAACLKIKSRKALILLEFLLSSA